MDYKTLVESYSKLESTTKRLEKTHIVSELLKKCGAEEIERVVLLVQGKIFPTWDERKAGVATRLVLKSLSIASGDSVDHLEESWKKTGDLGETAKVSIATKTQGTLFSKKLTVKKVFENMQKLSTLTGAGTVDSKVKLIAELLTSASGDEAKFIIRNVLVDLRLGVGEGVMRDAIVWAYFPKVVGIDYINEYEEGRVLEKEEFELSELKEIDSIKVQDYRKIYNRFANTVQEAYDITNDFTEIVKKIVTSGITSLESFSLDVGRPIKVMLAKKVADVNEGFEVVGTPCAIEYKLDGFRMQIHKNREEVNCYTRRLEKVNNQFPDVIKYVKEHVNAEKCILDCEVVGIDKKTKSFVPFQLISQRIRRKYNIAQLEKELPVQINVFDLVNLEGENLIKTGFQKRREQLAKIIDKTEHIQLVPQIITSDAKEANEFYQKSLDVGNEGVMLKKLDAPYKPGSRVGHMVKLKPIMETLDCVIVGAEWGSGKRGKWLASFILAVRDDNDYLEIGKVGTGFKELEGEGTSFNEMTELLKPHITNEKGKSVKINPEIVIEISYEEIQKSPTYSSHYALRFPRLVRLRNDRRAEECSTIEEVEKLFGEQ